MGFRGGCGGAGVGAASTRGGWGEEVCDAETDLGDGGEGKEEVCVGGGGLSGGAGGEGLRGAERRGGDGETLREGAKEDGERVRDCRGRDGLCAVGV